MKRHHSRRGMPAGRVCAAVRPTYTPAGTQVTGRQLPVGVVLVFTDTRRARVCFESYCRKNGITADVVEVISPCGTGEMSLKDMVAAGLCARAYYEVAGAPDSLAKLLNCWFIASQGGSCENDRMTPVLSVGAPRPIRPNDFIRKPYPSVFVQTLREQPAFKDDDAAVKVDPRVTYRSNVVARPSKKRRAKKAPKPEACPFPLLAPAAQDKPELKPVLEQAADRATVDAFIAR